MSNTVEAPDWSKIPAPKDDGAARHLPGTRLPAVPLPSTGYGTVGGGMVDLSGLSGRTVVYAYPRTGRPDRANPDGWDLLPGARGCTPQSCAFRDHFAELKALGVRHLFGLSTQDTEYQQEAAARLHLPFALLSDAAGSLTRALELPTMVVEGMTLLKRFTLIVESGTIRHVFYPVFPPDRNATDVIDWIAKAGASPSR
jgi:peroxiredoxin